MICTTVELRVPQVRRAPRLAPLTGFTPPQEMSFSWSGGESGGALDFELHQFRRNILGGPALNIFT